MNCEHCQELFLARERGELGPEVLGAVAAHVRGCAHCARAEATLHELNALLDAEVAPSPGLRRQVLARLDVEAARRKAPVAAFTLWFARVWPSRPLGAFSYSLALVLCGVFGGQLLPHGSGANLAEIPAERLYQLCAVPAPPARDVL